MDENIYKIRKKAIVLLGSLGNFIIIYDLIIYQFLLDEISKYYFGAEANSSIWPQIVYMLGLFSRPITALILNMISDIWGRTYVLQFSILISTIGAALMVVIPGYEEIGMLSPILFLACRFLISAGCGGEHSTSLAFLVEHTSVFKRGKVLSFACAAETLGLFFTTVVVMSYKAMTLGSDLDNYWKLLFLVMIPFSIITMLARKYVFESVEFLTKNHYDLQHPFTSFLPIFIAQVRTNKHLFIPSFLFVMLGNITYIVAFEFIPDFFIQSRGLSGLQQTSLSLAIAAVMVLSNVYLGDKSDKTGRIIAIHKYALLLACLWLPFFYFMPSNFILSAMLGLAIMIATCGYFVCGSILLIESISSSAARCSMHVLLVILPGSFCAGVLPAALNYMYKLQHGYLMLGAFLTVISLIVAFLVLKIAEPLDKCEGVGEYSLDNLQI